MVNAQVIEDYEARKIGMTYLMTKNEIREYRRKNGAKMSWRENKRSLINAIQEDIRSEIIGRIDACGLIEYKVKDEDAGTRVTGELKVYIPKIDGER